MGIFILNQVAILIYLFHKNETQSHFTLPSANYLPDLF